MGGVGVGVGVGGMDKAECEFKAGMNPVNQGSIWMITTAAPRISLDDPS